MQQIATCLMFVGDQCGHAEKEVDRAFARLSEGPSTIRMPLQAYPFSSKFGWVDDRFGVSWQLNLLGA